MKTKELSVKKNAPKVTEIRLKKVSKTFRLEPSKLTMAQRTLGTRNATETIEMALDMVVFRKELVAGTRAMLGIHIDPS